MIKNADYIIYTLTKRPEQVIILDSGTAQMAEIAKARSRLHRLTDGFVLNYRTVADKLHVWRA